MFQKFDRDPLESPLEELVVWLDGQVSPHGSAAVMKGLLKQLYGGVEDYEIVAREALLAQSRETQRIFSIVMGCIASISPEAGGGATSDGRKLRVVTERDAELLHEQIALLDPDVVACGGTGSLVARYLYGDAADRPLASGARLVGSLIRSERPDADVAHQFVKVCDSKDSSS